MKPMDPKDMKMIVDTVVDKDSHKRLVDLTKNRLPKFLCS